MQKFCSKLCTTRTRFCRRQRYIKVFRLLYSYSHSALSLIAIIGSRWFRKIYAIGTKLLDDTEICKRLLRVLLHSLVCSASSSESLCAPSSRRLELWFLIKERSSIYSTQYKPCKLRACVNSTGKVTPKTILTPRERRRPRRSKALLSNLHEPGCKCSNSCACRLLAHEYLFPTTSI